MKYAIVYAEDVEVLAAMVNEKIKKGWMPLGGVAIGSKETWEVGERVKFLVFCQAMNRINPQGELL
jgi:hypothetical protein